MRRSRFFVVGALLSGFAWMLAGGCGANANRDSGSTSNSGTGPMMDASSDTMIFMSGNAGGDGNVGNNLNPLCGEGACLPEDPQACRDYEPPLVPMGGA